MSPEPPTAESPDASPRRRAGKSPWTALLAWGRRHPVGFLGASFLVLMVVVCLGSLPWMLRADPSPGLGESGPAPRFNAGAPRAGRLPPSWWTPSPDEIRRINALVAPEDIRRIAAANTMPTDRVTEQVTGPVARELRAVSPIGRSPTRYLMGTDTLGRSLLFRCLTGGAISLIVGLAAAAIGVVIGTVYGTISGYVGGRTDAVMMRFVDILYGLPYVLLVVLIAVAGDALVEQYTARTRARSSWVNEAVRERLVAEAKPAGHAEIESRIRADAALREDLQQQAAERFPARTLSESSRTTVDLVTLLVAIGGVSWLTMARIIRAQVQSLREHAFIEAARAIGVGRLRLFFRHLLPNLSGPIIVYATLTVPQAILQESFLSFLGIGVKPPLPSWGNLAADGLSELNPYQSNWWLLLFPCVLLGATLLAMNFVGEALRESLDPRRSRR